MRYQRLHIRVPASGGVILSLGREVTVEADIINISAGGICISAPSQVLERGEYRVEVITPAEGIIRFSGLPVYQTEDSVGMRITAIEVGDLKKIYRVVQAFQLSEDFIRHIDQGSIIDDWFIDDDGRQLAVTFEATPRAR